MMVLMLALPVVAFAFTSLSEPRNVVSVLNAERHHDNHGVGLYRRFSDHALETLEKSGLFEDVPVPDDLKYNTAPAKGMENSIVQISVKAMAPVTGKENLVKYARIALLETIAQNSHDETKVHTAGIQVLNFIVIPSDKTNLPVLGIDLVTLPGGRNLLLLDAQPMVIPNPHEEHWKEWHTQNILGNKAFPWGGDFPEPVQKYVSKYALWTRLQQSDNEADETLDPISIIQGDVWEVFTSHLDLYLNLLKTSSSQDIQGRNDQSGYLEYRRSTDPAKPMLNALYGADWTDKLLDEVLFPPAQ
eukprot:scaffold25784_cov152-Cylindrotheca_fusiformis.AAC.4